MNAEDQLQSVREELDEHLDAINQNTQEVSLMNEYVSELDVRVEKLAERLDVLQSLLSQQRDRLTVQEHEILSVLLDARGPLTSLDIGRLLGIPIDTVAQLLFSIGQKRVPLRATVVGEQTLYVLDDQFKARQELKILGVPYTEI